MFRVRVVSSRVLEALLGAVVLRSIPASCLVLRKADIPYGTVRLLAVSYLISLNSW